MNFDDFFRQSSIGRVVYDWENDRFLFNGKVYSADDDDDDLAYLDPDPRLAQIMRDIKRDAEPSDIERMEDLLWETMQAFLDFKKKQS